MTNEEDARRDVFWKMYQEHCTQGRHHEIQRSSVATALIAIAVAAIGVATLDKGLTRSDLPLTLFVVAIGAFGAVFSAKHYERFRLHMERARTYRDALDDLLASAPLRNLKKRADEAHERKFPHLHALRLNGFWTGLHVFVLALGLVLTTIAALDAFPPTK